MNQQDFKENELIIYMNGADVEIGKIKRLCNDGAFVWYHDGDTAAKTPYDKMLKLINAHCVACTTLGADLGSELPDNIRDLHIAAAPVVEYLYKHGCPHSSVIVTQASAELLQGDCVTEYKIKD